MTTFKVGALPDTMRVLSFILAAAIAGSGRAEPLSVAAAANLSPVLRPLNEAFERGNRGVNVTMTTAATGNLVAMIIQGAPYDVFLSADLEYPRRLIDRGAAVRPSLVTFAYGKLVLWTGRSDVPLATIADAVRSPAARRIAIANPKTAPFGRAATETLARLGLTAIASPKLVFGENVSQTAQFVSSGNADLAFLALSSVSAPSPLARGHWVEVPADLYSALPQGAVLTQRGANRPAAAAYIAFLQSAPARAILARFGYGLP